MTSTTTETFGKSRLLPLDLLRGIAALLVALGHFSVYGTIDVGPLFALCVPFFFILSGYVLTHAYGSELRAGELGFHDFVVIRVARLYPLHVLTTVVVIAFWGSVALARFVTPLPIPPGLGLTPTVVETVETFTLTQMLFGGRVPFNSPSWSISVEFWGSLYVFLLCLPGRLGTKTVLIALVVAAFGIVEAAGGFMNPHTQWVLGVLEKNYVTGLGCFTLGWALRVLAPATATLLRRVPEIARWAFAAVVIAAIVRPPVDPRSTPYVDLLYYGSFAVMIAGLSHVRVGFEPLRRMMALAGDWSYGIYLWHAPLMLPLTAGLRMIEKATGAALLGTGLADVLFVTVLFLVCAISYKRFELPAKRWVRARAMPARSPALQTS